MARQSTIYTARTASRALWSSEEPSLLTDAVGVIEPVLLHRCRFGQALYDWRATAMVGRFICRGCGIVGQCGTCAELRGQ